MNEKLKALQDNVTGALSSFWTKLNSDIGELWSSSKVFVIIFGALILLVKFREIIISLIVANSKTIFDNATKKDAALHKEEDRNNKAADDLVKHSEQLASSDTEVTDDWNTKK